MCGIFILFLCLLLWKHAFGVYIFIRLSKLMSPSHCLGMQQLVGNNIDILDSNTNHKKESSMEDFTDIIISYSKGT